MGVTDEALEVLAQAGSQAARPGAPKRMLPGAQQFRGEFSAGSEDRMTGHTDGADLPVQTIEQLSLRIGTLQTVVAELGKLASRNDQQIDDIQIQMADRRKEWFRNGALLVAVISLLFSFGTTAVTLYRTYQQDNQAARAELRTLLQRIAALPKENIEAYKNPDPMVVGQLSGAINNENLLLAKQAQEVIRQRLVDRGVSASEYILLSSALINSGLYADAEQEIVHALRVANDPNEIHAALTTYGLLLFASGNIEGGREQFKNALSRVKSSGAARAYLGPWLDAQTEIRWALAEGGQNQCSEARRHLAAAANILSAMPPGQGPNNLSSQIEALRRGVEACSGV